MARNLRAEVEGGLYHIIVRGVNGQTIFHSSEDYNRFLSLLRVQKETLSFYLYAYCLMPTHFHLALERQQDPVGRIMHRVLTGYSQYYNRKYGREGSLFYDRYKAILCQPNVYLGELVRYIHLNPVRSNLVRKAERYPYSSQRAYLGIDTNGMVDVDPVLRLFGSHKQKARDKFAQFVTDGEKQGHVSDYYRTDKGILGSDEFVDATRGQIRDAERKVARKAKVRRPKLNTRRLISAVERVSGLSRKEFLDQTKLARVVRTKEILIAAGRQLGASVGALSELAGLSTATVSRRYDAAMRRSKQDDEFRKTIARVVRQYGRNN